MPKYTATDNTTGKSVSFEWHDTEPPTDADLEDVFAEARSATPDDGVTTKLRGMGATDAMLSDLDQMDRDTAGAMPAGLAMAGGVAGGPLGAGLGAYVGGRLRGKGVKDAAVEGGATAAGGAIAGKAITAGLRYAGPQVQRLAGRFMKGALKADRGYLEKMAGSKRGGISKMEDEIVDTALSRNINPVTRKGIGKVDDAVDDVAAKRTARINAAPNAPIALSAERADRAARVALGRSRRGDAPSDDIAAVESFIKDLRSSPKTSQSVRGPDSFVSEASPILNAQGQPITRLRAVPGKETSRLKDLTPTETAETITAGNERLRGLFNGTTKNSEIQARLGVQRARTASLDKAANTKPLSDELRRLIDLRNVGNIALRRADSANPISLTDVISLSTGRLPVLAGSVGMKSANLGRLSVLLNRMGRSAGKAGATDRTRSLLGSLLASHGSE